jgi:hypothetical protein
MIYLYAFLEGIDRLDALAGIAGEAIELIDIESLTVAIGRTSHRPELSAMTLDAQDRVVRELQRHAGAVLPLRFGAAFDGTEDAARAIRTRKATLAQALTLVRGKEQMTLRITGSPRSRGESVGAGVRRASAGNASAGAQYLRQRAAARVPDDIRPLLEALRTLQSGERVEAGRTAGVIATVYHLIARGRSEEYVRIVHEAERPLAHLAIRVTGPSPCYAFA